jgi:hypothetical protein
VVRESGTRAHSLLGNRDSGSQTILNDRLLVLALRAPAPASATRRCGAGLLRFSHTRQQRRGDRLGEEMTMYNFSVELMM